MNRPSIFLCVLLGVVNALSAELSLKNDVCALFYTPETLSLKLAVREQSPVQLTAPQTNCGAVAELTRADHTARWILTEKKVAVTLALSGQQVTVQISAQEPGDFSFPVIPESTETKGWILPLFEGVYVPSHDKAWMRFLTNHDELNTTADFGMPFLGLHQSHSTVTYIFTNAFNNEIQFETTSDRRLQARFTHHFTRNQKVKEYGLLIEIGKDSPVEPARLYRRWLQERGEFVSLKEKISRTPEAAKLLGAPHAYLWGSDLLHHTDITNWKEFALRLLSPQGPSAAAARRVWALLQPTTKTLVTNLSKEEWPDKYTKTLIVDDLNLILSQGDFYDGSAWNELTLDEETLLSLKLKGSSLSPAELAKRNCALLHAGFPNVLNAPETWGNGVSIKMILQLKEAGFDRFWLGTDGWEGLIRRPEIVTAAKDAGYLIGPYDSFHSIHHPQEKETWETAQFDLPLYESGGIVKADGTRKTGFKKKGFLLSPIAARPYVEKRVARLMDQFHANSWFIDCDGFGEYFDDYSLAHPSTQFSDLQARNSRMSWIRDTYGAVIGSEGCSAGVASTIHFSHGVMTPVIGWGDTDMNDKQSQYYIGAYYPKDEPKVHFLPVPIKEEYRQIYFEPRFRLPLFETVFHDSVVATHHWSFASFKTKDQSRTVELLELLYNIPPLYHLNIAEFQKRKAQMKKHYDFFSAIHREAAVLPMTGFEWVTPDASVQRTTFGQKFEMIANFGATDFNDRGSKLPPESVLVRWIEKEKTQLYVP